MSDTLRLLLALLECAPILQRLLDSDWPPVRDELLDIVGSLQRDDDSTAAGQSLDALLDLLLTCTRPQVRDLVQRTLQGALPPESEAPATRGSEGAFTAGGRRAEELAGTVVIPVFYGTDRARGESDTASAYYSGKRGSRSFGIAHVSVPTVGRDKGELTAPSWWKFEFSEDPAKHVILTCVQALERDSFVDQLRESLASADVRDALIFVHGYNVSFEDAARRAAQLSVDLSFPGRTLLYSWASAADAKQYTVDEDTIDWSRKYFDEFLRLTLTGIGADQVHVIAHSMGNRAVMNTLERLEPLTMSSPESATLCQVIFAAPDIGRDRFLQLADAFKSNAKRCTLYASSRDVALKASRVVHGYPRAGEAGESLVVVDGVDTIDASTVDTSLLSLHHSYFGSEGSILKDMASLIAERLRPDERGGLQAVGEVPARYWRYGPSLNLGSQTPT